MKFTPPIRRVDTARGHHYEDAEGRRVPGATTILSDGLPKPALINWAGSATAEAAVNRWEELAELPVAARLKELQGARYAVKDRAANRGTEVHDAAEKLVKGETVDVAEEIFGYVESYARFLDDCDVEPLHVESSVASYKHGYAGTLDLIANISTKHGRQLLLADIKTNRSGIYGETALQLAAYRYAEKLIDEAGEHDMPEVEGCAAIHVRGDGYDLIPLTVDEQQFRIFLYAQQISQWAKTSRDLVGAPVQPHHPNPARLVREELAHV